MLGKVNTKPRKKIWLSQYISIYQDFYYLFYIILIVSIIGLSAYYIYAGLNKSKHTLFTTAVIEIILALICLAACLKFKKHTQIFLFFLGVLGYAFGISDEASRVSDSHPITTWYHGYYYALFHQAILSHLLNYQFIIVFDCFALIYRLVVLSWDTDLQNILFLIVADIVVLFGVFDRQRNGRKIFHYLLRHFKMTIRFENFIKDYWPSDLLIVNTKEEITFAKSSVLQFGKETKTQLTQSGLSLFTLEHPDDHQAPLTEKEPIKDMKVTFVSMIQSMLSSPDYNEKNRCVASIMVEDVTKLFEINMVWIRWDTDMSLAVIFNDISHQVTIKNLKESEDSKDKVIASMSHEIRTPINGMKGVLKMIEKTTKNPLIINYLNLCYKNCDFLLNIVNSMLDMQLLSAQKFKLNLTEINIINLFSQIQSLFEFHCSQTGLTFHCEIDNRITTINTDKNRLTQILVNLIGNAIKFTSKGGITLTASIDPDYANKVMISVTDTGIGIKEEDKAHLFTMFGKLDDSKKINVQGIGLGLVISNELVKILNQGHSSIEFESIYNVGTRFFFRLPYNRARNMFSAEELMTPGHRQDTQTVEQKINIHSMNVRSPFWNYGKTQNDLDEELTVRIDVPEGESERKKRKKYKVMIVDDNPFNLTVHQYLVKDMGFEVVTALNGLDAIQKIKENAIEGVFFRMILTDLEMPIMDGFELIKKIRDMIETDQIPATMIVALSSHEGEEERKRCVALGVDDYLTKPLDEKALLPIFDSVIGRK